MDPTISILTTLVLVMVPWLIALIFMLHWLKNDVRSLQLEITNLDRELRREILENKYSRK